MSQNYARVFQESAFISAFRNGLLTVANSGFPCESLAARPKPVLCPPSIRRNAHASPSHRGTLTLS
jgi:hypothetical protein